MKIFHYFILLIIISVSLRTVFLMPLTKARFTDKVQVKNNLIAMGNWPSPTLTPTPSPTSAPTPTPSPTSIPTPTLTPTPTPNPNAANTRIDPAAISITVGQNFTVDLIVSNAKDMGGFDSTISFNTAYVDFVSAALGPFTSSTGRTVSPSGPILNSTAGTVAFGANSYGINPAGPNGEGVIAIFTFKAKAGGQSNININKIQIFDRFANLQPNGQITGGTITAQ